MAEIGRASPGPSLGLGFRVFCGGRSPEQPPAVRLRPQSTLKIWIECGSVSCALTVEIRHQVTSSNRTSPMVPNMELPIGSECTTRPRRCCRKLANPSTVVTKTFWKDGTSTTNTASLCQKLGGLSMTNLHWKITPTLQQKGKEIVMREDRVLKLSKEGVPGPLNQRLWFRWSKTRIKKTAWWTCERDIRKSILEKDEGLIHRSHRETCRILRLHQLNGNRTIGSRTKVVFFLLFRDTLSFFSLASNWIPWQSTGIVDRYTCRTPHFHMHSHCTEQTTCVPWLKLKRPKAQDELRAKIGHSSTRHVSSCASQYTEHQHKFSPTYLSCVSVVLFSEARLVVHASTYPLWRSTAGWYFSGIPLHRLKAQEDRAQENSGQTTNQKIDDQDDIEEIGVKPLFYSQSAYDSAGSIATPPDSDLEDEQLRQMLSSPLKLQEWKENEGQARAYHSERQSLMINSSRNPEVSGKPDAECVQKREAQRIQGNHSKRERLMTSSSRDLEVSGKLDAVLSCHSELSQNTFSERDRSNDPGNRFVSSVHSVFRFADPANVGKSLLDGNKDHLLNQARSDIMKQEH